MMLIAGCTTAPPISVNLSPSSAQGIEQGQTVGISATVANDTSNKGVTWSLSGTLSINADGSGNLGANTVAVTNGTVLYLIDETGKLPPLVQVFEP